MLQVSQRAHYGLRAMTELAKAYGRGTRSLAEIAEIEHLPVGYLEQLAMPLRRAGLIEGTRGAHGGYRLARSPADVTVGDVVRAVEGQVTPVECLGDDYVAGSCARDADCLSRTVWRRVKQGLDEILDSMTLADVSLMLAGDEARAAVPVIQLREAKQSNACSVGSPAAYS